MFIKCVARVIKTTTPVHLTPTLPAIVKTLRNLEWCEMKKNHPKNICIIKKKINKKPWWTNVRISRSDDYCNGNFKYTPVTPPPPFPYAGYGNSDQY